MESDRKAVRTPLAVVAVVAAGAALYWAREVFVPIALALLLYALLQPVAALLHRRVRLPTTAAAIVTVLAAVAVFCGTAAVAAAPAAQWAREAPRMLAQARGEVQKILRTVQPSGQSQGPSGQGGEGGSGGLPLPSTQVVTRAFGATFGLVGTLVEVMLLTLFLLASGNGFRERMAATFLREGDAPEGVEVIRRMEGVVSRYVFVTALINLGEAILVGLALWLIGFPNPLVWAALTFVLEFIPFLGGIALVVLMLAAGLASGGGLGRALLAPGVYLAISTLQNNLASPVVYSRGLKLNPAAVLVAVMVFWFLWGTAGAFLAVPIASAVKVLADRTGHMAPLARLLG